MPKRIDLTLLFMNVTENADDKDTRRQNKGEA